MTWTRERPTQEGAYWFRDSGFEEQVVTVYDGPGGLWVSYPGSDVDDFLNDLGGEFADPIPEPEERTVEDERWLPVVTSTRKHG